MIFVEIDFLRIVNRTNVSAERKTNFMVVSDGKILP